MSVADKIAAEHPRMTYSVGPGSNYVCGCGDRLTGGHARHVATVTEAAVRAQIAADIKGVAQREAERAIAGNSGATYGQRSRSAGINWFGFLAARIARGGAS